MGLILSMKNKKSFLKSHLGKSISQQHKDMLGTSVPDDYFKNSRQRILASVKENSSKNRKVIVLTTGFKYAIAASIAVLITLTIWLQTNDSNDSAPLELSEFMDDTLINSLFVDDAELDSYTKDILVSEVLIKAELSEQSIENVFMNSLFIEDSLLDDYMDNRLVENIIL